MAAKPVPPHIKQGNWVVCGVSGDILWPSQVTHIQFRGQDLILVPPEDLDNMRFGGLFPSVALNLVGISFEDGQRLIASFLSSLAWADRQRLIAENWSGGNLPRPMGGRKTPIATNPHFDAPYLPEAANDRDRMALAFFREGMSINHVAYQCLSFFKVLNLILGNGKKSQIPWIDANWQDARKREVGLGDWEVKAKIDLTKRTVGQYLYGANRSAVAHADMEPIVDPDDLEDQRRMQQELPMVRVLAEHAIETRLGIKTSHTIWNEHLYELADFKEAWGPQLVARIMAGEAIGLGEFAPLPPISMRLAFHQQFSGLEGMRPVVVDCADRSVGIELTSPDGRVGVLLGLDFGEERLEWNLGWGIGAVDDGSPDAAREARDVLVFKREYIRNGILELWSNGRRIARKDAYIPVNIDPGRTDKAYERMIEQAEETLKARS